MIHNELVITDTSIVFRQATDGNPMEINLEGIAKAEARIADIQCVTPTKAPELLAAFTIAWRDLDQLVTLLNYQHVIAQAKLKEVRARILVDEVPDILKKKGLPSSKDVRDAVIDQDPKVQELVERVQQIFCILELIKGKKEAIGMAFSSVKRIVGEGAYNMLRNLKNPNLSGDTGTDEVGEQSPTVERAITRSAPAAFGQPNYR